MHLKLQSGSSFGSALVFLLAILVLLPVLGLVWNAVPSFKGAGAGFGWRLMSEFVAGSLLLSGGVAVGTMLIGVLPAWLVAQFEFPGRRWIEWLLVLPMAMPAYIMAYSYADFFQYAGPLQTAMREVFGWQSRADYFFPEIRSLPGAILILSLSLYPYVYVLARVAFLEQPQSMVEAARVAGLGKLSAFWRVALPIARPAIVAGAALAAMEALAEFGTVSYFGISTLTTGVFKAWFAQGDLALASRLGLTLLVFAVLALGIERASRSRARFDHSTSRLKSRSQLFSGKRWIAFVVCALPCVAGFFFPVALLIRLGYRAQAAVETGFVDLALNSAFLALVAALLTAACAVVLSYAARKGDPVISLMNRASGTGYAVPGLVLAVGIAIPALTADRAVTNLLQELTGQSFPLWLSGSVALLLYAYLARFLGIGLHTVESGLSKITPSIEDAARSMGATTKETLRRVHLPMLKGSGAMATLLVFVDVLKELPATFVLRPFNFDTLAVRVYSLALDERLGEAAAPALLIVAIAVIPVILTTRTMSNQASR